MTPLLEDPSALRAVHARARSWAQVLRLPFRQQRWRGSSGEFMGAGVGSSLDFQDHRVYLPGDDPRQINWQAYARTGTYTMKLYREEVRPLVDLIFDVSDSMFAFPEKEKRTLEIFAYVVEASLQTGATLRCFAVCGAEHRLLNQDAILGGRWPAEMANIRTPEAERVPLLGRIPVRAGSMRIFISDLLFAADPESLLNPLSSRNGRGIIFAPYAVQESAPAWDGNYEFEDAESLAVHDHRVEPDLLKKYEEAYRRHFELWKAAAIKHGVALARLSAEVDFQKALQIEGLASGAVEMG